MYVAFTDRITGVQQHFTNPAFAFHFFVSAHPMLLLSPPAAADDAAATTVASPLASPSIVAPFLIGTDDPLPRGAEALCELSP